MSTYAVYFSPTGNNKKSALAMANAIGGDVLEIDVTTPTPKFKRFNKDDFVIFAAPVYGGRIPKAAMERFRNFFGDGTACIVVAAYGNRHYDDSLVELAGFAADHGFVVKGAAAPVGRHTFGHIEEARPNEADLKADAEFALKAFKNASAPAIPGNRPYKDGGNGGAFRPSTLESCVKCGKCAALCPMNAIGEDCSTIDNNKCISCFRCIRICPVGAKAMVSEAYDQFAEGFTQKLSVSRDNEYFL